MKPSTSDGHARILSEVSQLGRFYGIDDRHLFSIFDCLTFDCYTEIVLQAHSLDLVVGGVGKEDYLMQLAAERGAADDVIGVFDRLTRAFPQKMPYLKLCLTPNGGMPTLYSTLLEPWEQVLDFLRSVPSVGDAADALEAQLAGSQICFILGARLAPGTRNLMVKTYHLADRTGGVSTKPTLISHRIANGAVSQDPKYYTAAVQWEQLIFDSRWKQIVAFCKSLFQQDHPLMLGEMRGRDQTTEKKVYVFRQDIRQSEHYKLSSYNFYRHEGLRLVELRRYYDAVQSFTNAIDFQKHDAHAYNDRGYCFIQLGECERAIRDCRTAMALDATISPNNLRAALSQCGLRPTAAPSTFFDVAPRSSA
jgi:hypothetical protein